MLYNLQLQYPYSSSSLIDTLIRYLASAAVGRDMVQRAKKRYSRKFTYEEQLYHEKLGLNYKTQWLNQLHKSWIERLRQDLTAIISHATTNLRVMEHACNNYDQSTILKDSFITLESDSPEQQKIRDLCVKLFHFARHYNRQLTWCLNPDDQTLFTAQLFACIGQEHALAEEIQQLIKNYARELKESFERYQAFRQRWVDPESTRL